MSLYSIPVLIGSTFSIIAGCTIYLANRRSRNNISFSLSCFSLFVWLFGYTIAYSTKDEKTALLFCRIACTGAMFTAPTFYNFAVSFLDRKKEMKFVVLAYLAMIFIAPFSMTSELFLSGVYKYYWGYYSKAGFLHPIYLIIFFGIFFRSFYILLDENSKQNPSPTKRAQIKYIFIAYAVALLGAIDYVPKYGIEIFPFGFLFEILFIVMVAYAIITRRIVSINIMIVRAILFILLCLGVMGMLIWINMWSRPFLSEKFGVNWWLIPSFLSAMIAALGSFAFMFLGKKAENTILKPERHSHVSLEAAARTIVLVRDFHKLLNLIVRVLARTMNIKYASIYLRDKEKANYIFCATRGGKQACVSIECGNSLVKYLKETRKPIVLEELKRDYAERRDIFIKEMVSTINRLDADILVPSFADNELIGFLALGNKKSGDMYTTEDLNVLSNLASQSALAIENAQFLKEREEMQAKLRRISTLAAMGELLGIMDHELNNKLGLVSLPLQNIIKGFNQDKPEQRKNDAIMISNNISIVVDILHYMQEYRQKSQSKHVTEYDLLDCLERAKDHSKDKTKEWNISVTVRFIPKVMIKGYDTFPDIFKHLFVNSVHSIENRKGSISVTAREFKEEGIVEITHEDTGEDISEELKKKELAGGGYFIERGKVGGVNLVLVQKIVSDHKGSLRIESKDGHGARFIIRLPIDFTKVA